MPHIAIDAMSGDSGPSTVVLAIRDLLEDHPDVIFHLVGDTVSLQAELEKAHLHGSDQVVVHHASQVVAMDETPSQALRGKRDSSMHVAISLVREGHADAVVSAGNTGALMALGKVFLRTIPGIDRPAIAAFLPTTTGRFLALDLGANVDCRPEHLLQFAVMGSILAEMELTVHPVNNRQGVVRDVRSRGMVIRDDNRQPERRSVRDGTMGTDAVVHRHQNFRTVFAAKIHDALRNAVSVVFAMRDHKSPVRSDERKSFTQNYGRAHAVHIVVAYDGDSSSRRS